MTNKGIDTINKIILKMEKNVYGFFVSTIYNPIENTVIFEVNYLRKKMVIPITEDFLLDFHYEVNTIYRYLHEHIIQFYRGFNVD